jgi:hypothetical protein
MDIEQVSVVIPRKQGVSIDETEVPVWPLVEAALDVIGADPAIRDAARSAMETSEGCVVLGNYLNSQAKRVVRMDYRFKVPLIVLAAEKAREDGLADSIYDGKEGAIYFETDDGQYSFHTFKDWTVDWPAVADEQVDGYEWSGIENQAWAVDQLLKYL